jgi:EmrB/QacA subfamily drug resistance transporter
MTDTITSPRELAEAAPYRWRWLALAVVLATETMDLLDSTIVGVAAPSVRADLGGSYPDIQWLAAAYTLVFAVGLVTGGRLGDIHGRWRALMAGLVGFMASSMLCALAPSIGVLLAMRAVQGACAAIMIPQGYGIVTSAFPRRQQAAAFGFFGPVMALASVGGPVLAGALIDADLWGTGWRAIFLINVPLGLLALCGLVWFVPKSRAAKGTRLDLVGTALLSTALLLLVFPLVQGRENGWPLWMFASMAAAPVLMAVFLLWEARVVRAGRSPLVVPSLLPKRAFSGSLVVGLLFFASMNGLLLTFVLFLQLGLDWTPLRAGLELVPIALGVAVGAGVLAGTLAPRFGRRVLHAGVVVMALGVAGVSATLHAEGSGVGAWQLAPALTVTGVGMGMLLTPFFDIALASVDAHEVGSASGLLNANQQLGGTLGVAVLGTLFFALLGGQAHSAADDGAPGLRTQLLAVKATAATADRILGDLRACAHDLAVATNPDTPLSSCGRLDAAAQALPPPVVDSARRAVAATGMQIRQDAFAGAMERVGWAVVAMLLVVAVAAFLLPRRAREPEPADSGAEVGVFPPDTPVATTGSTARRAGRHHAGRHRAGQAGQG